MNNFINNLKNFINLSPILIVVCIISKEVILLNEEIFVIITAVIFIYLVYQKLSSFIADELENRDLLITATFGIFHDAKMRAFAKLARICKKLRIFPPIVNACENFPKKVFLSLEKEKKDIYAKERKKETHYQILIMKIIAEEMVIEKKSLECNIKKATNPVINDEYTWSREFVWDSSLGDSDEHLLQYIETVDKDPYDEEIERIYKDLI